MIFSLYMRYSNTDSNDKNGKSFVCELYKSCSLIMGPYLISVCPKTVISIVLS
jgi:hypothetical protein